MEGTFLLHWRSRRVRNTECFPALSLELVTYTFPSARLKPSPVPVADGWLSPRSLRIEGGGHLLPAASWLGLERDNAF
jgi:hypothetical protein